MILDFNEKDNGYSHASLRHLFSCNLIISKNKPACVYFVKLGFNEKIKGHSNYHKDIL